jgi:purine nucleosidase/pyrimidine-specific ribonucleoside hydrolase
MNDTKARKIVIDTDPGIDDAIGILLALRSPEFSVAGMTTVAGNIGLETTTRNAGRLLAFAGRDDIPVFRGASAPLSRPAPEPLALHGEDGLGGVALPEPVRAPESRPAMEWLADFLLDHPAGSVDVLALGPLTNLAHLVLERPEAARRIGRIIAMGGAIHEPGNVGPRSEFNLAADPEAAAVVLKSGIPLVLVPLDVTRRVRATRDFVIALAESQNPTALMVAHLIKAYFASSSRESRPLHDPCVMLFALSPDLFGCENLRLDVSIAMGDEAGELTLVETGGVSVQVAMTVDAPAVLDLLTKRVTAVPASRETSENRAISM